MHEYAFPQSDFVASDGQVQSGQSGMSLLDYFAAKAMQANISTSEAWLTSKTDMEALALFSYEMGESMLNCRKERYENI